MDIQTAISALLDYAERQDLIEKEDRYYFANNLVHTLGIDTVPESDMYYTGEVDAPLKAICDYAFEVGILERDSVVFRDLFDTRIMGLLTPRPAEVRAKFFELYKDSPEAATDYFYKLAISSNYIREDRIKKDMKWRADSKYGEIDITVNLAKPEKDPKAIALAKLQPQSDYPKCLLCHENEGFFGNLSKPARQNLRQMPLTVAGEKWYLQYSPYVYYNEHCIALSAKHTPMQIERATFKKLLSFVESFPHYFMGSNADLPIVGGSILSHDHCQGGRYTFAMEKAKIGTPLSFAGFDEVNAGIVKWPMSVIRLRHKNIEPLVELADKILTSWRGYTDEESFIFASTNGEPHNTITPIARKRGEKFELDLVLRNNITTDEYPLGVYHPHSEHHNIKKENIGLIEVMGLAVLPSRLKNEIALMTSAILNGTDFDEVEEIKKHKEWFSAFCDKYSFTEENTEDILKSEIGKTFVRVLEDSGVFKDTEDGRRAFMRFVDNVNSI